MVEISHPIPRNFSRPIAFKCVGIQKRRKPESPQDPGGVVLRKTGPEPRGFYHEVT
jgi:hypothetical protein